MCWGQAPAICAKSLMAHSYSRYIPYAFDALLSPSSPRRGYHLYIDQTLLPPNHTVSEPGGLHPGSLATAKLNKGNPYYRRRLELVILTI